MISVVLIGVFLTATFTLFNRTLILAQKVEQQNLANQALASTVANLQNILEINTDIPVANVEEYLKYGVLFSDNVEETSDPNGRAGVKHTYKRSTFEIDQSNCVEGILEEYKYPSDLNRKPQYPICVQVYMRTIPSSKNVYCYGIKVITKVSQDEVYTSLINGISMGRIMPPTNFIGIRDYRSSDNFGCQF